jgi:ABC-type nitrate/sulfonate/bicarbonate transport system permease component
MKNYPPWSYILVVLLWQIAGSVNFVHSSILPTPIEVGAEFITLVGKTSFYIDLLYSITRFTVGITLGSIAGISIGLLTGVKPAADRFFTPVFHFARAIPPVALLPLYVIWFGVGEFSKLAIIGSSAFFPVWLNTHQGVRNLHINYLRVAHVFCLSPRTKIFQLYLPGSLAYICAGISNAIGLGYIIVFVAEFIGTSTGIGFRISEAHILFRVDRMICYLLILGSLGLATNRAFESLSLVSFPWLNLERSTEHDPSS